MYIKKQATIITAGTRREIAEEDFLTAEIVMANGWVLKNRFGLTHADVPSEVRYS